jgi:hypothetical protein
VLTLTPAGLGADGPSRWKKKKKKKKNARFYVPGQVVVVAVAGSAPGGFC